jgi:hypothetical protein
MVTMKLRPRSEFYFTVSSWELTALRHMHRAVEDHLEEVLSRYDIAESTDVAKGEAAKASLELMMVEARIPALFRVPVITASWALYEACLVEVSRYFESRLNLPFSVGTQSDQVPPDLRSRWRRWNLVQRGKHFFETQLQISLFPVATEQELLDLRAVRNVLSHAAGRLWPTDTADMRRLKRIAESDQGLSISTGYVVASRAYVEAQIELVERSVEHVVNGSRGIVESQRLYESDA